MNMIPFCPPVELPLKKHSDISTLNWFASRNCKLHSLRIVIPDNNHIQNLRIAMLDLYLQSIITINHFKYVFQNHIIGSVRTITINGEQNKLVLEQLSLFTGYIDTLLIGNSDHYNIWLTSIVLSNWKVKNISIEQADVTLTLATDIVQKCPELQSFQLNTFTVDDAIVMVVAQHCPKLEKLELFDYPTITYKSLIALSERGLPIKELNISNIPNIPTADIARRCSHALSCIRHLNTDNFHRNGQDASILLPYMTELTSVRLDYNCHSYTPLLIQQCHKLTSITLDLSCCGIYDVLPLCHINHIQQFRVYNSKKVTVVTDTALIELIHACPHLHALYLPYENTITDIGILALSEHCPQLQWLDVRRCTQVTDAAVLQLLQRCRKLTRLQVSSSSLSEETWAQLDKNIQKRMLRW